ncbi:MAG: PQQ-binding-like beta-propeller repeat protein [Halobacteriales archaeon]
MLTRRRLTLLVLIALALATGTASADEVTDVAVESTNSPVVEGERLDVTTEIEWSDNASNSTRVELSVGGEITDTANVTPSDTRADLSWNTTSGDAGEHAANVSADGAENTTNVSVETPSEPSFNVSVDSTNSPVIAGYDVTADVNVTNQGDLSGTREVEMRSFDGDVVDARELELDGGETWNGSLVWSRNSTEPRTGEVTLESPESNDSAEVSVQPPLALNYDTGAPVWSSPTVHEGTVYVGDYDGVVHAVDIDTRTEDWTYDANSTVRSSPTVADGVVYVGSDDGRLHAIDQDGRELWNHSTGGHVASSPTVFDGVVYFGSLDGEVYALDAESGDVDWTFETGDWVTSSPTVVDDSVYVGSHDTRLYSLDRRTGEERWNTSTGWWIRSSPVVEDGVVYVSSASLTNSIAHAFNASTGEPVWSYDTDDHLWIADFVISSPNVADDTVYMGSADANVYAFDAANGSRDWTFETGEMVRSSPVVADGVVYVGSHDGNLYALDGDDGTERWRASTGGAVFSSPSVVDGVVYVGSSDGRLYGLEVGDNVSADAYSLSADGSSEDSRVHQRPHGHHGLSTGETEMEPPEADFFVTPRPDPTVEESTTLHSRPEHPMDDVEVVEHRWHVHETDENLTGRNAKPSFTEPGTYNVTLTVEDELGQTDNVTRSIEVRGAGAEPGPRTSGDTSYYSADIDNTTVVFDLDSDEPDDASYDVFRAHVETPQDATADFEETSEPPEDTSWDEDHTSLGYLDVEHELEDVEEAGVAFDVSEDRLEEENASRDDVVLQRHTEDGDSWETYDTLYVDSEDGVARYWAEVPGASVFSVGVPGDGHGVQPDASEDAAESMAGGGGVEPTLEFTDVSLDEDVLTSPGEIEVEVDAEVAEGLGDTETVELNVDNETVDSERITVDRGETRSLTLAHELSEPGSYAVEAAGRSFEVEVEDDDGDGGDRETESETEGDDDSRRDTGDTVDTETENRQTATEQPSGGLAAAVDGVQRELPRGGDTALALAALALAVLAAAYVRR